MWLSPSSSAGGQWGWRVSICISPGQDETLNPSPDSRALEQSLLEADMGVPGDWYMGYWGLVWMLLGWVWMLLGAGSEGCWAPALQSSCTSKVLYLIGLVLLAEVVYTEEPCCPQVRAGQLGRSDVSLAQFIPCPALSPLLQLLPSTNPPVPPQTASSMSFTTGMNDSSRQGNGPFSRL